MQQTTPVTPLSLANDPECNQAIAAAGGAYPRTCKMCGNGPCLYLKPTFRDELKTLINKHSLETGSDTPDHVLADYLVRCLSAFDQAVIARQKTLAEPPKTSTVGDLKPVDQIEVSGNINQKEFQEIKQQEVNHFVRHTGHQLDGKERWQVERPHTSLSVYLRYFVNFQKKITIKLVSGHGQALVQRHYLDD